MNYRHYPDLLREVGLERELDGILLDLGVSSWQMDNRRTWIFVPCGRVRSTCG